MTREDRIDLLAQLGDYLGMLDERLEAHMHRTMHANPWFTIENQKHAVVEIAEQFLDKSKLIQWVSGYPEVGSAKRVGIVAAGNIPMVAFHDVLCTFITGHTSVIKLSERDPYMLPFIVKKMGEIDARATKYFEFVERLQSFDAVIATGSNNSARYFEQYFAPYPHIIRKNRNGIAVLGGNESLDALSSLGEDVFRYYGLGCRNVSFAYVPKGYTFDRMKEAFTQYREMTEMNKFKNNIDYNLAIYMLNKDKHQNLGTVVVTPSDKIISPVGVLHYQEYQDINDLEREILSKKQDIQCVVSEIPFDAIKTIAPGSAQRPTLTDYADGVDTMAFLTSLD